jgi:putative hydrolase of the HAD superfamily
VRAVFFDVGGTLIHVWPSVGEIYSRIASRHGINVRARELERRFHESWKLLKHGGLTVSRKEWWRELVFRTLGQQDEECFAELFELFAGPEVWRVFPDVVEALAAARTRGWHVGVISNWDARLRPLLERLDLARHFDSITISCEVGAEKPDARIFHAALQASRVKASEAMHIGDSAVEDVKGAEAVGMVGRLIDRAAHGATLTGLVSEAFSA